MFCDFFYIHGNLYKCKNCNIIISTDDNNPPIFPCVGNISYNDPSFIDKIKNLSHSIYKHINNGFVLASDEEIKRRFGICQSCEYFKNNLCTQCGCPVNRSKNYISKLSWKSEDCPVNKW